MSARLQFIVDKWWINFALFFLSLFISFFAIEVSVRHIFPSSQAPLFGNYNINAAYPEDRIDESLGWVNPTDEDGYGPWGEHIAFDSMGFRKNGNIIEVRDGPLVLAMGNSFTFGSEVNNTDTWPSQLEAMTGTRVVNGAIAGYGLDQMLTRTRSVLEKLNWEIDIIIITIIEENIKRVKQKRQYGAPKPYYTIENQNLVLNKVQLKDYPRPDLFKIIFGKSYAVHLFMSKLFGNYWLGMEWAAIDEVEVSCRIVDEFVGMAPKVPYLIFALLPISYEDNSLTHHPLTKYIRNVSRKNDNVFLIDIQSALWARMAVSKFSEKIDTDGRNFFNDRTMGYHGHYSKVGNEFVAGKIFAFLRSIGAI